MTVTRRPPSETYARTTIRRAVLACAIAVLVVFPGCGNRPPPEPSAEPLRLVVMDPLSLQLSCDCVAGFAQRRYDKLASFLQEELQRPIKLTYAEDLSQALGPDKPKPHLIIGKQSVILADAMQAELDVSILARLSGPEGQTDLRGVFVVSAEDTAKSIRDLKGRRVRFGPKEADEKHAAALAALRANGIEVPENPSTSPDCGSGCFAIVDGEADAAVISDYALPLLEGCGKFEKGELRVIGQTETVPFITAFAADDLEPTSRRKVFEALRSVRENVDLRKAMETRGFVPPASWPDWRGPRRDGLSHELPDRLPTTARFLWKKPMSGSAMAGVAVHGDFVIVADKSKDEQSDIWRCLNADTGKEIWSLTYSAPGEMEYGNAPRANPVIDDGKVWLLGAFGHLRCVRLTDGEVLWKRDLNEDFGAEIPQWGHSATPLLVDGKLIVAPGSKEASLVALNAVNGEIIWRSPGREVACASLILAKLGGRRQLVGYDSTSLGGWDPSTGKRLWEMVPELDGDFNVPTPIIQDGHLLVTTENNGTRLFRFDDNGILEKTPFAKSEELAPNTCTPVVVNGLVFGVTDEKLICLDAQQKLKLLWEESDEGLDEYASLIGGSERVLALGLRGELLLFAVRPDKAEIFSRMKLFQQEGIEIWSHPALVPGRLYIRTHDQACCLLLSHDQSSPAK